MRSKLKLDVLVSVAGVFGSAALWLVGFKIVALWLGPAGVGLLSQLRQIAQAATIGATFGGTNPYVQGISERPEESVRLQFRSTAWRLVAISGMVISAGIVVFASSLASYFFSSNSPDLTLVLRWVGVAVLLNAAATYTSGVLNGYRSYFSLALVQLSGPAVLVMVLFFGLAWSAVPSPTLFGVALALCFGTSSAAGVLGLRRLSSIVSNRDKVAGRFHGMSGPETVAFLRFAMANLVAALATTLTFLLIRTWIIDAKGLFSAGIFDAGWTLTFNYVTIFLTACSAIYLPLLTRARDLSEQRRCILKTAYVVLGSATLFCYVLVLFSGPVVQLLYSDAFAASEEILAILVIAIIFRSVSWVYGALMIAAKRSRVLLGSDIALNLGLLAAVKYALIYDGSLTSVAWAFVFLNFVYVVFVVEYVGGQNHFLRRKEIWPLLAWSAGPLCLMTLPLQGPDWGAGHWLCFVVGCSSAVKALLNFRKVES